MESGWNPCQQPLHPIGQIYRILVGVVSKFCVVSKGRRLGCCVGENGSRSICAGPDSLSLLEVMARSAGGPRGQIGKGACRGRGENSGGGGSLKKKKVKHDENGFITKVNGGKEALISLQRR